MWNVNFRRGCIWTVKSCNSYENNYLGMMFGSINILILSAFVDENGISKYTYLKITKYKSPNRLYKTIYIGDKEVYVLIDEVLTGDRRALESFNMELDLDVFNDIMLTVKQYFNLKPVKTLKNLSTFSTICRKPKKIDNTEIALKKGQQLIHKFGIDIYVTENEDVHITDTKRIILSQKAKEDIIYNSTTKEDINTLCNRYQIYPEKTIREIKNRLVYQYKHK